MSFGGEDERECGYRQWHGVYFMSGSFVEKCDRGVMEIEPCVCCGEQPRFNRGITRINPQKLFGNHILKSTATKEEGEILGIAEFECKDPKDCYICFPPTHAFLDWVGKDNYTPESFLKEAHTLGISRRLPKDAIPVDFVVGKTVIYLAMQGLIEKADAETVGDKNKKPRIIKKDGIFLAYIPTRIEKLFHAEEFTKHNMNAHDLEKLFDPENTEVCGACLLIEEMISKNITPVFIDPTDDRYHTKSKASRKKKFEIDLSEKAAGEKDKTPSRKSEKPKSESKKDSKRPLDSFLSNESETLETSSMSEEMIENTKTYEKAMTNNLEEKDEPKETSEDLQEKSKTLTQEEKVKDKYSAAFEYLEKKDKIGTDQEVKPIDEEIVKMDSQKDPIPEEYSSKMKEIVEEVEKDELRFYCAYCEGDKKSSKTISTNSGLIVCSVECQKALNKKPTIDLSKAITIQSKQEEKSKKKKEELSDKTIDYLDEKLSKTTPERNLKSKKKKKDNIPTTNLDDAYESFFGFEEKQSGK